MQCKLGNFYKAVTTLLIKVLQTCDPDHAPGVNINFFPHRGGWSPEIAIASYYSSQSLSSFSTYLSPKVSLINSVQIQCRYDCPASGEKSFG